MGNTLRKPREKDATKDEQQHQEKEVLEFTCEICIEPTLSNRKFLNGGLCVHPFCLDCIAKYVQVKVEGVSGNIICPGLKCNYLLDPMSCKPIIAKPIFEKWCDLLCDSAVSGSDRCYCPYQDCSALVLNECRDKLKKTKCPNCKKSFCFRCKIPWHAGYRCSESRQLRDRNDLLVGELIEEKKWTRCYNCGHSVERVSGCRDIKCKFQLACFAYRASFGPQFQRYQHEGRRVIRCGVQFCHQCGGRYHLGPCRHKCCGDFIVLFCVMMVLVAFAYLFFHQVNLVSPNTV